MPWKERSVVQERHRFIEQCLEQDKSPSEPGQTRDGGAAGKPVHRHGSGFSVMRQHLVGAGRWNA